MKESVTPMEQNDLCHLQPAQPQTWTFSRSTGKFVCMFKNKLNLTSVSQTALHYQMLLT